MYSIKKVSELLEIPAVTIRAWENRYHIITPVRSEGGHRLYSEEDIQTLIWLKQQMGEKHLKISEAVRLFKQTSIPAAHKPLEQSHPNRDELMDKLYHSVMDLNGEQANDIIDLAFSFYKLEEVFHHILTPILYQIGEQWEAGSATIAQEHFASQLFIQRFNQFFRILPIQSRLPRVLALCPEGEHHHIGLMLFSLFLRKQGMDVIYLGPNTPFKGITDLIAQKDISVIVVSITHPKYIHDLQVWIETVLTQFPALKFALGGNGLHDCPPSLKPYLLNTGPDGWEAWCRDRLM